MVVTHQLDADGDAADVPFAIPHAPAGMIGAVALVESPIGASIAGNDVVGMSAVGSSSPEAVLAV